jgi:uncharacterized RmlC-like cupin family protein
VGGRAKVHYHQGIETIAYLLDGECVVYYGDRLEHGITVRAGEQVYMPADVPHAPANESPASCTWIVVHASGSDQDGIVSCPISTCSWPQRSGAKDTLAKFAEG